MDPRHFVSWPAAVFRVCRAALMVLFCAAVVACGGGDSNEGATAAGQSAATTDERKTAEAAGLPSVGSAVSLPPTAVPVWLRICENLRSLPVVPGATPFWKVICDALFAGDNISIALLGLGNDILVTNEAVITVSGLASADGTLNAVKFENQTTGASGTASGTTEWLATVTLVPGDNRLKFVASSGNASVSILTTITYAPNLGLTSPLTLGVDVAFVGEPVKVLATIGIATTPASAIELLETSPQGTEITVVGPMRDNGALPDEIDKDGIATVEFNVAAVNTGQKCYRARVVPAGGAAYQSEVRCIQLNRRYSPAQLAEATAAADLVQSIYNQGIVAGQVTEAAADTALTALRASGTVGASGIVKPGGGLWWVTNAGILGAFHPALTSKGQKGGTGERGLLAAAMTPAAFNSVTPTVLYPAPYLFDRSRYVPQPSRVTQPGTKQILAAGTPENRIGSNKAVIISPFITHPSDPGNSFGNADDYFVPWQKIKNGNQCQMYSTAEYLNNGSMGVSLESFKGLSAYGLIHVSTHGDNFYNGLLSLWKDEWGPNGWLTGGLSQVVLYSGVRLAKDASGSYVLGAIEADVQAKRLAIAPGGHVVLLPGFFQKYLAQLPNSLVVLSACRSTYNNTLANVFLSKGAGSVIGYDNYVQTSYAQTTLNTIFTSMYDSKTVKEAFDAAVSAFGSKDGSTPAANIDLVGSTTLQFGNGELANLGFESGTLSPWQAVGDGRIISQLGATLPTSGKHMGVVSTGLGFTVASGSVQQDTCLPAKAQQLTFRWNFFSEEFKEYCGSIFQDRFRVEMCEVDKGVTGACTTLFSRTIDEVCASAFPSDVKFDQGGVFNTGWASATVNVSPFAGKSVRLRFGASDVGDSIYDSAILIDDISLGLAP